jgi:hypothetical protein
MAAQAASVRASTHLESSPANPDGAAPGGDVASAGAPSGRVVMQVNPLLEAAVEFVKVKLQQITK